MLGCKLYRGYNHMMLSTSLLLTCCREGSAVPQDACRHLPRIHTCTSNPAQPPPPPRYPHDSGHFQQLCEHPREQQNLLVLNDDTTHFTAVTQTKRRHL